MHAIARGRPAAVNARMGREGGFSQRPWAGARP